MDFQEDIRKQQLLDKINVIRTITSEAQESAVEPISKSLFDEFEGSDVDSIEKNLNIAREMLGEEAVQDILKARSGKYLNTYENRQMGRVGQPYGHKGHYDENTTSGSKSGRDLSDKDRKETEDAQDTFKNQKLEAKSKNTKSEKVSDPLVTAFANKMESAIKKWMDASEKNGGDTDVPEGQDIQDILDSLMDVGDGEMGQLGENIGETLSYLEPGDEAGMKHVMKVINQKLNRRKAKLPPLA